MNYNTSTLEHFIAMMKERSVSLNEGNIHEFINYAVKNEGIEYLNELEKEIRNNLVKNFEHVTINSNDLHFIKSVIISYIEKNQ